MGQKSKSYLAEWFQLKSLSRSCKSSYWTVLQSSEGFNHLKASLGLRDSFPSPLRWPQFLTGYWIEGKGRELIVGGGGVLENSKKEVTVLLYPLEVTCHHFCHILTTGSKLLSPAHTENKFSFTS